MAMTVNTNTFSLNAQRQLMKTESGLQTSMQRLSSGLRINSAKDDAAGLQIANRMSAQVGGLSVAIRNANDGISLAQTAEGAMEEMTNSLLRMRDLALQASNGTYGSDDKNALDAEFDALVLEIDRIADTTSFNGKTLLDGTKSSSTDAINLVVGTDAASNNTISVKINDFTTDNFGGTAGSPAVAAVIDDNGTAGDTSDDITISPAVAAVAAVPGSDLTALDITTDAASAITAIDSALQAVDSQRASLGAVQNRLTSTVNNLSNVRENLSASRSRVMDTDFAAETANLSKYQVMQQAGTAVLAQANAVPQNVLSLLR